MKIFVISDTHFGHENMYKFTDFSGTHRVRKEFQSAHEGDLAMIERWNAVVSPQDHVYHLGDVSMGPRGLSIVGRLNGRKRLVLGNHDKEPIRDYLAAGFQKIFSSRQFDRWCILTHIPIHPEGLVGGKINIHGHIHERPPYDERYRNVSVERINYTPVELESLR